MDFKIIFSFLKNVAKNNNREWFAENKQQYLVAKNAFETIVQKFLHEMEAIEPGLMDMQAKDCIYRIFRDIRFSKDKIPYKTNFGAVLGEGGRKTEKAFYYLQIEPGGKSFVAGGLWMPDADKLKKIRQEIDYNADKFRKVLNKPSFKQLFPTLEGHPLKRAPKGYAPDDPNIDLLKNKSFVVFYNVSDKKVNDPNFLKECMKAFKEIKPFNEFLNTAIG